MIVLDPTESHYLSDETEVSKETLRYIIHEPSTGFRPAREDEYYLFEKPIISHTKDQLFPFIDSYNSEEGAFSDIIKSLAQRKPLKIETNQSEWTLEMIVDECQKLPLGELKILKKRIGDIIKSQKS